LVKPAYCLTAAQVAQDQKTDPNNGLSKEQVAERLEKYGSNQLKEQPGPTVWAMMLGQLMEPLVLVLIGAALVSLVVGELTDAVVILLIVLLNAGLGVWQEKKAEKSLAALRKLSSAGAKVIRDGEPQNISAAELVPGDLVLVDEGDFIPADGRLIEAVNLAVDESALTGESVPVEKGTEALEDAALGIGDRTNMVFKSTVVTYGRGRVVVTGTGMQTQIGQIAELIQAAPEVETPLQKRLAVLGKTLGLMVLGLCALIFLEGILRGNPPFEMFMTAISLAVAAIPEGLPAIVTIVLALGVQRMSYRNAIIRKLPAVETLGSATVICSDKTGTLTQNKMTVQRIFAAGNLRPAEEELDTAGRMLVLGGALDCNASICEREGTTRVVGDPTEGALVMLAASHNLSADETSRFLPRVAEAPFDSVRKRMTTLHRYSSEAAPGWLGEVLGDADGWVTFTKGAPDLMLTRASAILLAEGIVPLTEELRSQILGANEELGEAALRVLAVGMHIFQEKPSEKPAELAAVAEDDLIILGLVGMMDPPRPEAREAISTCQKAGIRPIMITGDHLVTARAIGRDLGLLKGDEKALTGQELEEMDDSALQEQVAKVSVYARVSPEHKVRIVDALKANNHIVAMTGDGVNDAPALRRADIGAAMGVTGTDVAKEAADMVLADDNFATIVAAVAEGRTIFANIKKAIRYLLSCNSGELVTIFLGILFGWPRPLVPIQILWVNLVTDGLPALALGVEPGEPGVMTDPPRDPDESFFAHGWGRSLMLEGLWIGIVSLFAFYLGWREAASITCGRTMAFATLSFSQLFQALNSRSEHMSLFKRGVFSNKAMNRALLTSSLLQLAVMTLPPLQKIFHTRTLSVGEWAIVLLLSVTILLFGELRKAVEGKRG